MIIIVERIHKLTLNQSNIINYLLIYGESNENDIATFLGIGLTTAKENLYKLSKKGLVQQIINKQNGKVGRPKTTWKLKE